MSCDETGDLRERKRSLSLGLVRTLTICKPGRQSLLETPPKWHFDLRLGASRTGRNAFLLFSM